MATLTELVDSVRFLTGVEDADILSDTRIMSLLNQSYQEVCNLESWPFMERIDQKILVQGAHALTTSAGVLKVQELVVTDLDRTRKVKASPVTSTLIFGVDDQHFRPGLDIRYDVQNSSVDIWPAFTSDVIVDVRFQGRPDTLGPDDSPVFRSDFHEMLAYRAAYKVLVAQADETGRLEAYPQEFVALLEGMRDAYLLTAEDTPFQLSGRGWGL